MHALMKLDMSGVGAILGAMSTLRDLGCLVAVTGWLMSGSALLGIDIRPVLMSITVAAAAARS